MSAPPLPERAGAFGQRIARIVTGVVRQALAEAGARALIVLDDGSPEALLAHDWCAAALGANFVALARGGAVAAAIPRLFGDHPAAAEIGAIPAELLAEEARRLEARLLAHVGGGRVLVANAANKTALLLGMTAPPEPLLPLGDLYATDVRALTGGWSVPAAVRPLVEAAGGIDALDAALRAHFDERRSLAEALQTLPPAARDAIEGTLQGARSARARMGLVPKLGPRTLGVDLFA